MIFRPGQRRLDLAKAIVSRNNPLTRRVLVNWVWQQHFGQGLVATPDDFGTRGRSPTHPELLDYLAEVFLEDGWSIKKLHRRIMLSRAYRQGAIENEKARELDPENELMWRMPRRRLEMEAMRDAMLFVSEELDMRMGGRPVDFAPIQKRCDEVSTVLSIETSFRTLPAILMLQTECVHCETSRHDGPAADPLCPELGLCTRPSPKTW